MLFKSHNFEYLLVILFSFVIRMSLPGLPPLPKSLSGLELASLTQHTSTTTTGCLTTVPPATSYGLYQDDSMSASRKPSTLDTQLATLRNEMVCICVKSVNLFNTYAIHIKLSIILGLYIYELCYYTLQFCLNLGGINNSF